MFRKEGPEPIFEEKLIPSSRKDVGRMTYRKVILFVYLIRLCAIFLIFLFAIS